MKQTDISLNLFDISNDNAIDVIKKNAELKRYYVETPQLPRPFYGKISTVKAIVLGPDPSLLLRFKYKYVYGLEDPKSKYFISQELNLRHVGINLNNVYVQNLVQSYCNRTFDHNPMWYDFAEIWKPMLKQELDTLFSPKIPVFFTVLRVFQALMPHKIDKRNIIKYYNEGTFIAPSENYLNRTLIPLQSTHIYYKHDLFSNNIKALLGT